MITLLLVVAWFVLILSPYWIEYASQAHLRRAAKMKRIEADYEEVVRMIGA